MSLITSWYNTDAMVDIEAVMAHQKAFLDQVKAREEPAYYTLKNIEFKVNPGVFPPATDSRLLAGHIETKPNERILDLTAGAGIFAIIAGLQGATGIAVDVNPEAVKNAQENFLEHKVNMQAVQSDLFENIPAEEFDQIFVNGPFFEGDITDSLDYACYGAKSFYKRLFSEARLYLKPSGKLLIVLSEASDLDDFEENIRKNRLESTVVDKKSSNDGQRVYRLYNITLPS